MANAIRTNGLSPVKHLTTGSFNGQVNVYSIAAADVKGYAPGDPVVSNGTGDSNGIAGITLAAATGALRGAVLGLGTDPNGIFNPSNLNSIVRPAAAQATNWYALVVDDPKAVFEVGEAPTGTALTAADIGNNANLVVGTNNGFASGWYLSNAATAGTSTLQVKLLGLVQRADNTFGNGARWLVMINSHELSIGTAGV